MKRSLGGLSLAGLAALTLMGGCNGADEITGPPPVSTSTPNPVMTTTPTPVMTPLPRPTPPECLPPYVGNLAKKNKPCIDP